MKIEKVFTDKFYDEKYVSIDDAIFTMSEAQNLYPDEYEAILKTNNSYTPSKGAVKVTYKAFPSNDKMIDELLEKRQNIYKELNTDGVLGEDAKIIRAMLIFDHLSKSTNYDMTSEKEVEANYKVIELIEKKIDYTVQEYIQAKKNLKTATTEEHREKSKNQLGALAARQIELQEKLLQTEVKINNRSYLKNLYNVLIRGKGVCSEFSYAYQFLLDGLDIKSFYAAIAEKGQLIGHAINFVEYQKDGKRGYYIADITDGNKYFKTQNPKYLNAYGFGTIKKEYFNDETQAEVFELSYIKKITKNSEEFYNNFITMPAHIEIVQNALLDEYVIEKEYEKANDFYTNKFSNNEIEL